MAAGPLRGGLWETRPRGLGAWVLGALLAIVAVVLLVAPGQSTPPRFAEEATYLLQAESLARDLDRVWGKADRDRYSGDRPQPLARGEGKLVFARPPLYSLVLAPFVRVAGMRGAAVANLALLVWAILVAHRFLYRRLSDSATWLLVVAVFASVLWVDVFLAQPEILLLASTVSAFALAYGREEPAKEHLAEIYRGEEPAAGSFLRWGSVGVLLAVPILHHPLYLLLVAPAVVAIPGERRYSRAAVLLVCAASIVMLVTVIDWAPGDSWLPSAWAEVTALSWLERAGGSAAASSWAVDASLDGRVQSWNLVFLLVGRHVGLLPYFLPLVLLLGAWKGRTGRSTLVTVVLVTTLLFLLLEPFNFFGGPGAVGNRWFVPLFGALWFVPTRPVPRSWMGLAAVAAAAFLWPLWLPPSGSPAGPIGQYRHSSGWASSWLPYETTQQGLASGGESRHGRLWTRAVSGSRVIDGDRGEFELAGEGPIELLIAAPLSLISLYLEFESQAEPQIEVQRGELEGTVFRPNGRVGFNIRAPSPRRHRMWWSDGNQYLYLFKFRLTGVDRSAIRFRVTGLTVEGERGPE